MPRDILLLKDYRDHFYSSARQKYASLRIDALVAALGRRGITVKQRTFAELDLRSQHYRDQIVLYQSSEDRDLLYKSYIEDVMLALSTAGARLVPPFTALRAHHNKVFMELLRDTSGFAAIQNLKSRTYGTLEEFDQQPPHAKYDEPLVFKPSEGLAGIAVRIAKSREERRAAAEALSRSFHLVDSAKDIYRRGTRPSHRAMSNHRRKFLTQDFVPGLAHDYKVIPFESRVYVLQRGVRPNDFRASGSGRWTWLEEPIPAILDYAQQVRTFFDVPWASLDIGFDGATCYLFEFQFLMFGTATIESSPSHFQKLAGTWHLSKEHLEVEEVFAESLAQYIPRKWPHESA
jgi:hypothetical protein